MSYPSAEFLQPLRPSQLSEYHSPFLPVEPQNLHSAAAPWTQCVLRRNCNGYWIHGQFSSAIPVPYPFCRQATRPKSASVLQLEEIILAPMQIASATFSTIFPLWSMVSNGIRIPGFTEHGCRRVQSEKTLTDNSVMKSIICRATDFAIAITCGIERAQSMLSEARLIRSSGNAHDLHRFAGELQPALMKIQRDISHAQSGIDVSFLGVDYSRNRPLFCY